MGILVVGMNRIAARVLEQASLVPRSAGGQAMHLGSQGPVWYLGSQKQVWNLGPLEQVWHLSP